MTLLELAYTTDDNIEQKKRAELMANTDPLFATVVGLLKENRFLRAKLEELQGPDNEKQSN